jgi:hypothetical protein
MGTDDGMEYFEEADKIIRDKFYHTTSEYVETAKLFVTVCHFLHSLPANISATEAAVVNTTHLENNYSIRKLQNLFSLTIRDPF